MLRRAHQALVAPSLAQYLSGGITSTSRLIEDCVLMLDRAGLDTEVLAAAKEALQAAVRANSDRNRVVHDMWMREQGGEEDANTPPTWRVYRVSRGALGPISSDPPRDLVFVEHALTQLERAHVRVFALYWALHMVLPFYQGSGEWRPGQLDEWVRVMQDRFDLHADGGFKPHSDD